MFKRCTDVNYIYAEKSLAALIIILVKNADKSKIYSNKCIIILIEVTR